MDLSKPPQAERNVIKLSVAERILVHVPSWLLTRSIRHDPDERVAEPRTLAKSWRWYPAGVLGHRRVVVQGSPTTRRCVRQGSPRLTLERPCHTFNGIVK